MFVNTNVNGLPGSQSSTPTSPSTPSSTPGSVSLPASPTGLSSTGGSPASVAMSSAPRQPLGAMMGGGIQSLAALGGDQAGAMMGTAMNSLGTAYSTVDAKMEIGFGKAMKGLMDPGPSR